MDDKDSFNLLSGEDVTVSTDDLLEISLDKSGDKVSELKELTVESDRNSIITKIARSNVRNMEESQALVATVNAQGD